MIDIDILVIGAGPAGYAAAIRAGQMDQDVIIVEKDGFGGTCLNHGCIPSKALIAAADDVYSARNAATRAIHADVDVDFAQLMRWKERVVRRLTKGVEKLCEVNGVTRIEGRAEFVDTNRAEVDIPDSSNSFLEFEHAIIATGSRPMQIPGFSVTDEPILDSKQALDLDTLPQKLVVIGAGYIGMELSMAFAKLGVDVTVVEMLDKPLPNYADDLVRPVERIANEIGVEFEFGRTASEWRWNDDGSITVQTEPADAAVSESNDGVHELVSNKALVAVGREPISETVNLNTAGIRLDDQGFIETNEQLRTSTDHIFAVGDVAGEPLLAHAGSEEGTFAAEIIAGEKSVRTEHSIPSVVFTDPEIAIVGLTEDEAKEQGKDPIVGQFPMRASGRALTTNSTRGFVRIIADRNTGTIYGGQIVGAEASEIVAEIGVAVTNELSVSDIVSTVHAHPTLSEGAMEATADVLGQAIHTTNR